MSIDPIVGYTFAADIYCPDCIDEVLPTGDGEAYDGWALAPGASPMSAEDNLSQVAYAFGIDRDDETTFDSGDFPKRISRSQVDPDAIYVCGRCFRPLADD